MTKVSKKSLENLKKGNPATQFKAGRQQVDIARKGAEANNKKQREGKLFQGLLTDFLKNPEKDESKIAEAIESANIHGARKEEITNAVVMTASVIRKAKEGDLKAVEFVRNTIGEKPIDKVENTNYNQAIADDERMRAIKEKSK